MVSLVLIVMVLWLLFKMAEFIILIAIAMIVVVLMESHTIPPINHYPMEYIIGLCIFIALIRK